MGQEEQGECQSAGEQSQPNEKMSAGEVKEMESGGEQKLPHLVNRLHDDDCRSGGEQHGKQDDEESVARIEEYKKLIEEKITLRQSNLNPERPDPGFLRTLDSSIKRNIAVIEKLKHITEEEHEGLMDELRGVNMSNFVAKAVAAICDSKLKSSDIHAAVQICSLLHQRYPNFASSLTQGLLKVFFPGKVADDLEVDNTSKAMKKHSTLKLLLELYFVGVIEGNDIFINIIKDLASEEHLKDRDATQTNLSLLTTFARQGRVFLGLPLSGPELHEEFFRDLSISADHKQIFEVFHGYYDTITEALQTKHTSLRHLEHDKAKILNSKGELSDENASSYEKLKKSYDNLCHGVSSLAEALDKQPTVMPEDGHTTRVTAGDDSASAAIGEEPSTVGPVCVDEDRRAFYECLPDHRAHVPAVLLGGAESKGHEQPAKMHEQSAVYMLHDDDSCSGGGQHGKQDDGESVARIAESKNPIETMMTLCQSTLKLDLPAKRRPHGEIDASQRKRPKGVTSNDIFGLCLVDLDALQKKSKDSLAVKQALVALSKDTLNDGYLKKLMKNKRNRLFAFVYNTKVVCVMQVCLEGSVFGIRDPEETLFGDSVSENLEFPSSAMDRQVCRLVRVFPEVDNHLAVDQEGYNHLAVDQLISFFSGSHEKFQVKPPLRSLSRGSSKVQYLALYHNILDDDNVTKWMRRGFVPHNARCIEGKKDIMLLLIKTCGVRDLRVHSKMMEFFLKQLSSDLKDLDPLYTLRLIRSFFTQVERQEPILVWTAFQLQKAEEFLENPKFELVADSLPCLANDYISDKLNIELSEGELVLLVAAGLNFKSENELRNLTGQFEASIVSLFKKFLAFFNGLPVESKHLIEFSWTIPYECGVSGWKKGETPLPPPLDQGSDETCPCEALKMALDIQAIILAKSGGVHAPKFSLKWLKEVFNGLDKEERTVEGLMDWIMEVGGVVSDGYYEIDPSTGVSKDSRLYELGWETDLSRTSPTSGQLLTT